MSPAEINFWEVMAVFGLVALVMIGVFVIIVIEQFAKIKKDNLLKPKEKEKNDQQKEDWQKIAEPVIIGDDGELRTETKIKSSSKSNGE